MIECAGRIIRPNRAPPPHGTSTDPPPHGARQPTRPPLPQPTDHLAVGPHQTSIILGLALQGRSLDECSRYIRAVRNKREDCKTYGTLGAAIGFMTWLWIRQSS